MPLIDTKSIKLSDYGTSKARNPKGVPGSASGSDCMGVSAFKACPLRRKSFSKHR
jgi:hypothetical protein